MALDMGESLVYSWLRHVKKCQIVENNWVPSEQWIADTGSLKVVSDIREKLDVRVGQWFADKEIDFDFKSVFKANSTINQIIKQAECDAIGIRLGHDTDNSDNTSDNCYADFNIYAVDIAIHTRGLGYGNKYVNVIKIVEKLARAAFCVFLYFKKREGNILFLTPFISRPCYDLINGGIMGSSGISVGKKCRFPL